MAKLPEQLRMAVPELIEQLRWARIEAMLRW
jgi:hypothetical protein